MAELVKTNGAAAPRLRWPPNTCVLHYVSYLTCCLLCAGTRCFAPTASLTWAIVGTLAPQLLHDFAHLAPCDGCSHHSHCANTVNCFFVQQLLTDLGLPLNASPVAHNELPYRLTGPLVTCRLAPWGTRELSEHKQNTSRTQAEHATQPSFCARPTRHNRTPK